MRTDEHQEEIPDERNRSTCNPAIIYNTLPASILHFGCRVNYGFIRCLTDISGTLRQDDPPGRHEWGCYG